MSKSREFEIRRASDPLGGPARERPVPEAEIAFDSWRLDVASIDDLLKLAARVGPIKITAGDDVILPQIEIGLRGNSEQNKN